jgi:hypothetical protein
VAQSDAERLTNLCRFLSGDAKMLRGNFISRAVMERDINVRLSADIRIPELNNVTLINVAKKGCKLSAILEREDLHNIQTTSRVQDL